MNGRDLPGPNGAVNDEAWTTLARDVEDRYHLHLERKDAESDLRYVAVARSLDVRPYAVVTTDLDELRRALCDGDEQPAVAEAQVRRGDQAAHGVGRSPLATPGGLI